MKANQLDTVREPITRAQLTALADVLGVGPIDAVREIHITPEGGVQVVVYVTDSRGRTLSGLHGGPWLETLRFPVSK